MTDELSLDDIEAMFGDDDELSLDDVDELLASPGISVPVKTGKRLCPECGEPRDANGYCTNDDCEVDARTPTERCEYCGHCSTPNECVASVDCPRCDSPPSTLCRDDRGGITGYHEDRWLLAKGLYGTYYK